MGSEGHLSGMPTTPLGLAAESHSPREFDESHYQTVLLGWVQNIDPPRAVPRPVDFFQNCVHGLWDADVRQISDTAMLEEGDVQYKSPMLRSFFKALVLPAARLAHPECVPARVPVRLPIADQSCNSDILSKQLEMFAQLGVVAKKSDPVVSVDMQAELKRLGLSDLADECKPDGFATDALLAKVEKLRKTKAVPFVNVKLPCFLPAHARDGAIEKDSEDEEESETVRTMQKVMGVKKAKKELNFLQCLEALNAYVLAGAMTNQFSLSSGLAHVAIVMQVASKAVADGKRHVVAVRYDKLVREKWANCAHQAGKEGKFDINQVMREIDVKVYDAAVKACEFQQPSRGNASAGTDSHSDKFMRPFQGICNYCKKPGHRMADCFKYQADQKAGGKDRWEQSTDKWGQNKRARR